MVFRGCYGGSFVVTMSGNENSFVYESGEEVLTGKDGEHEYLVAGGSPVTDAGKSDYVFESGTGIGTNKFLGRLDYSSTPSFLVDESLDVTWRRLVTPDSTPSDFNFRLGINDEHIVVYHEGQEVLVGVSAIDGSTLWTNDVALDINYTVGVGRDVVVYNGRFKSEEENHFTTDRLKFFSLETGDYIGEKVVSGFSSYSVGDGYFVHDNWNGSGVQCYRSSTLDMIWSNPNNQYDAFWIGNGEIYQRGHEGPGGEGLVFWIRYDTDTGEVEWRSIKSIEEYANDVFFEHEGRMYFHAGREIKVYDKETEERQDDIDLSKYGGYNRYPDDDFTRETEVRIQSYCFSGDSIFLCISGYWFGDDRRVNWVVKVDKEELEAVSDYIFSSPDRRQKLNDRRIFDSMGYSNGYVSVLINGYLYSKWESYATWFWVLDDDLTRIESVDLNMDSQIQQDNGALYGKFENVNL